LGWDCLVGVTYEENLKQCPWYNHETDCTLIQNVTGYIMTMKQDAKDKPTTCRHWPRFIHGGWIADNFLLGHRRQTQKGKAGNNRF